MHLNTLKPGAGSQKSRKRVGRGLGSGLGKTCGRGHKGQKSRSGGSIRRGFEGGQQPLQMRLPKFGFNSAKARTTAEVTLSEIAKVDGDVVDMQTLEKANMVQGTMKRAKVILSGSIDRPLTLKGIKATKGAREAIEAAGGKIEE
tara:strand:+ start:332 stop:766 length:435 start_codon:yes stop_codon:yes gene_type:complete